MCKSVPRFRSNTWLPYGSTCIKTSDLYTVNIKSKKWVSKLFTNNLYGRWHFGDTMVLLVLSEQDGKVGYYLLEDPLVE